MPTYGVNGTTLNLEHILMKAKAAEAWQSTDVLLAGEIGVETDTRKAKIGDGVTQWGSLNYSADPTIQGLVDTLTTRMGTAESTIESLQSADTAHEARMTTIEGVDTTQNGRLDALESADTTHEARMTTIEGVDTTQNGRLDALESADTTHEARMTAIEGVNTSQGERLNALEGITTISANSFSQQA